DDGPAFEPGSRPLEQAGAAALLQHGGSFQPSVRERRHGRLTDRVQCLGQLVIRRRCVRASAPAPAGTDGGRSPAWPRSVHPTLPMISAAFARSSSAYTSVTTAELWPS